MNDETFDRRILMVRHGSVAERYQGRCYGRSDVELGDEGRRQTVELAERLSALPITHLFHSGLSRARELADRIALVPPTLRAPSVLKSVVRVKRANQ